MTRTRRALGWTFVTLAALACAESITRPAPSAPDPALLHARIGCVANAQAATVHCIYIDSASEARLHAGAALGDLIVGSQNTYVTLASSNVTYTGDVFSFTTTVQNLLGQSLGTSDGTTLDANGVRVFFDEAPVATSGSGTIDFLNPVGGASMVDGTGTFTATDQAYYQYDQIIAPNQVSSAKTWRIHVPATVGDFEFGVYVSAAVPHPAGYIDVAPPASTLQIGATQQLTATLRDVVGRAESNETVTWSTGNASVATVNAGTGLVTAVAGGTVTITATTATRTGSAAVTVGGTVTHFAIAAVGGGTILQQSAGTSFNIQVTALDANNNTASFTGSATLTSTGTLAGAPITTAAFTNGVLSSQSVTITNSGSFTLTATSTSPSATGTSAAFTVLAGSVNHFLIEAAGGGGVPQQTAGTPFNIRITALDANSNTATGFTGTVTLTSTGTLSGAPVTTASFTSGVLSSQSVTITNTGTFTLTATSTTPSATGTSAGFTVAPGTVTHFAVTAVGGGSITPKTAGTSFNIQVTALDANGNTATSFGGTVKLTSTGALTGSPVTTSSFTSGVLASQSVTITNTGSFTLTATSTIPSATGTSAGFTVNAGAAASIAKNAGDGQSGTAGSAVNTAPTVLIRDTHGNPVSGVTVNFTVTGGGGSTTSATPATNASGIATVGSWTLGNTVGSNTLAATVSGLTSVTFTATGVAGAVAHVTVNTGNNQTAQVATAVPTAPSVLVRDAHLNPVPNATVTFAIGLGAGALTGGTQQSDASGLATVTSWTLGTLVTSNTLVATSNSINATFTATATPGPVSTYVVTNTAGSAIGNQVANNAFNLKIVAQDAFTNIATGFNGQAVLTSSGTLVGSPLTTAAFTSGILASQSVTISSTGATTITATTSPSGPETGTSGSFTVLSQVAISSSTPVNNATNVARSTNIVINYTRAVNADANSFTIQCPATILFNVSGTGTTTITLSPTSALPPNASCVVTAIAAQITDANAGTHPAADQTISFTTSP